ncbi:LysM peptidoglycan-binding domain-containing protein [Nocardia pneumoniae]|uniref:LysM peptidoglycan-binding domain-containing protein n=1 Tax=Nocardia pneumoniae TaxID=228601 RepID=UPI00030C2BC2|nr:LysM peptidoglycan-binding domain-containing protein [Nocardia pneumoniae]
MVRTHTVVAGDTLSRLAQRFYGNGDLFPVLAAANGIVDPNRITDGQVLVIPEISRTHTVATGDTLSRLAQRFYGDGDLFPILAAANGIADPNKIRVGQVLVVPELMAGPGGTMVPSMGRIHTVVAGDTLSGLAERFYGNGNLSHIIAAANHIADPDVIGVGQKLIIPPITRTYVVVQGDTLSRLAQRFYGKSELFPIIAAANAIQNPDRIVVGQVLIIPDIGGGPPAHGDSPFMLRRAMDLIRLQHDNKLALADDKEFELGRVRAWVASNPPAAEIPHGNTPQSILDSVEISQTRRRTELDQLRARLAEATETLAAVLDSEEPLFGTHSAEPIALLPVRLETKWTTDGRSIKVRVYPDDIHIESFDPALAPEELAAARKYWEHPGEIAWQQLLDTVNPIRAAWVTRAARPGAPDPTLRPPGRRRMPQVSTLPTRWRFLGMVGGLVVVDRTGADIPDPLPLGFLAADEAAPDRAHASWAIDFDEAVRHGMGVVLRLPEGVDHLDELFVVGVSQRGHEAAGERLRENLRGHAFSDGLAFLTPGTPTNNTPQSRTSWSSRPSGRPPGPTPARNPDIARRFHVVQSDDTLFRLAQRFYGDGELFPIIAAANRIADPDVIEDGQVLIIPARPGEPEPNPSDADRLARALGLPDAAFLTECDGADGIGDTAAGALSLFAWWGLAQELIRDQNLLDGQDMTPGLRAWLTIRDHLIDFVRGRGPLPTIRVGRQPYGVLPVSTLDEWVPDGPEDAAAALLPWLLRLRHHWRGALISGWIPRVTDGVPADRIAAEILSRIPVSNDMVIRRVLSATGGREKFDKLSLRAPGPAVAIGGILSGLRWATPTEDVSNLAWVSDTKPANSELVAKRLAPNRAQYQDLFAHSRDRFRDAVAVLTGEMTHEEFTSRWPITIDGVSPDRPNTIFGNVGFTDDTGSAVDFLPWLVDAGQLAGGSEPDTLDLALAIPATVDRLLSQLIMAPQTPQSDLDAILDFGRRGLPAAGRVLAGLEALTTVAAEDFLPLFFEILDLASHRLDAWITSLATQRLERTRAAGAAGIRLGGYGWVENLRPGTARESDGYIHAPSMHHAATAAVLRSGFLSHEGDSTLAVDLTSRRARTARWLLGGVRRGQNLGVLLGYRFERALHDAGQDVLKAAFRKVFPTPVVPEPADGNERPDLWERSSEAIAAANVVDGMALARGHAARAVFVLLAEGGYPFGNTALPSLAALPGVVAPMLDDLVDSLDAVGDLLLAESVHQLVGGNQMRAGIAADSLGRGEDVPDRFDVLRTPHRGRAITHRLASVLPPNPPRPPGWGVDAFSRLEPRVEAWAADLLGPAANWRLTGTLRKDGSGEPFSATADALGLSALGLVFDVAVGGQRRITAILADRHGMPGATAEFRGDFAELHAVAERINRLLSGAAALLPRHLLGDQVRAPSPDVEEVRGRVAAFLAEVDTPARRAALGIVGDIPKQLRELAADATSQGWLGAVARLLADFLGTSMPLTAELPGVALPAPAATGAAVADWVRRFATTRPGTRTWHETLLIAGVRAGRPASLSASQTPADGHWIGAAFPALQRPPTRQHLVRHTPFALPAGQPLAGLVFDEWVEILPGSDAMAGTKTGSDPVPVESELTGLSFHFDRPDAKAPQAILLAVPPNRERGWTADGLAMVVRDTLELAKLRAVDLADLPLVDDVVPAVRIDGQGQQHGVVVGRFWRELAEE